MTNGYVKMAYKKISKKINKNINIQKSAKPIENENQLVYNTYTLVKIIQRRDKSVTED